MFVFGIYAFSVLALAYGQCPNGWLRHDSSCYLFSQDTESWTDAMVLCEHRAGHLVEIADERENNFIKNNIRDDSWIGASALEVNGEFAWFRTRVPLTYTNWAHHQPDNDDNDEHCVEISRGGDLGRGNWNDAPCHINNQFICEKELV